MQSNYKPIGNYVQRVERRNTDLKVTRLLGLSLTKEFRETTSNIVGTDMSVYRVMHKHEFACDFMSPIRVNKLPVVLKMDDEPNLVSPAYPVFKVKDSNELDPEYLMMWFRRSEFDRYATFKCDAAIRGGYDWQELCNTLIPVPSIEKQREIVAEYHTIQNRIALNNQLIQTLETTAQAIYKQWFVEFEFPNEAGQPYKSSGGEMADSELGEIPKGWSVGSVGSYAKVKSGFAFASECWGSGDIPVIKIGSIQNNTIDPLSVEFVSEQVKSIAKNYKVVKGDLVIAMTGATVGKIGIIPKFKDFFLINQRVGMFDMGENPLSRAPFLYCTLLQDYFQNEIVNTGGDSAQQNISNKEIEKIRLLIGDSTTVARFNALGKPMIETILSKMEGNNLLKELANLLLSKLATIETAPAAPQPAAAAPAQLTLSFS